MKPVECEFEAEVLSATLQSRVDVQVSAHVAACAICADIVAVARIVDQVRDEMRADAVVPDSSRVWWMAQLRARREAVEAAGRPITAAQVAAFGGVVGLLGALFGATSAWLQSALVDAKTFLPTAAALLAQHSLLVLATVAITVLVPAAVYLAVLRD